MSNNFFTCGIPISIGDMISLQLLDLSNNKLSGGIPRHLPMGLVLFDVSNNQLFGDIPSSMENMSHLVTLDLSNNTLFGGTPSWMGKMLYLQELLMVNNHFKGPIPMEFCKFNGSLQFLDLSANNISGSLVTLDLSNNQLTGNIPNWTGSLSALVYLLLNNNNFEGRIPVDLCKLLRLRSFSADVPIEFTMKNKSYSYKGRVISYLSGIDLSCNKLTGEIPLQLQNFRHIVVLNFSHNSLIGPIPPTLSELSQIECLDLSHNRLRSKIPSNLWVYIFCPFSVWHTIIYLELHLKGPDNLQHLKKAVTWGILSFVVNHCQRIAQQMDHLHRCRKIQLTRVSLT
ncbi:hypothetical protein ERO13_D13G208033v2 [Gossypium hirsutum]|nr:hypothetical protein ERO13_D13G208033v2 [Gossypium hirsutum]